MNGHKIVRPLGQGSFGRVFLVESNSDGLKYALKKIDTKFMAASERSAAAREGKILSTVASHENVVRYHNTWLEKEHTLCLLMELCEGGDLRGFIDRQQQPVADADVRRMALQICAGVAHLHANRILHRDIKPANIFLSSNNTLKIGDLGVARLLGTHSDFARTLVGTPYYLSPELCEDLPYDEKSDVWAVGCCIYEICQRKRAFEARNQAALIVKIMSAQTSPIVGTYTDLVKRVVMRCLARRPHLRPHMQELLSVFNGQLKMPSKRDYGVDVDVAPRQANQQATSKTIKIDVIDARAPKRKLHL